MVPIPTSTYRVQLHKHFTLPDARRQVDYWHALGVGALYVSPLLLSRPGSVHGYDICDHRQLNPEIGTEEDLQALSEALHARGLRLITDIVPNHMAADPDSNAWWRDVLQKGPASAYAAYFDIDWDPIKPELKGKLLLPVLAEPYGRVLENGDIRLEEKTGEFVIAYGGMTLPLSPYTAGVLQQDAAREGVTQVLDRHRGRPDDPASFDVLHGLLEKQHYRLAYWKTSLHEINYRRFFDVNGLAGVRMENPQVFAATHVKIQDWIRKGWVDGLRVDHPDGLFNPEIYFQALQGLAATDKGDEAKPGEPRLFVVVEKILSPGESLPATWAVHGTTGYDTLNALNALFVSREGFQELRNFYRRWTGDASEFSETAYAGKKIIMETAMAGELQVLAYALNRLSEADRRSRDFTLEALRVGLSEVIACFPVYRTYIQPPRETLFDRQQIDSAVERAKWRNPAVDPALFDFIRSCLAPHAYAGGAADFDERVEFAMKFQQYTSPVQAKGVEDTAFYRHVPLLSVNEVGGGPGLREHPPASFHESNAARQQQWPGSLSATATHDTKRGEDARVRLSALTDVPREWVRKVRTWTALNARYKSVIRNGLQAPDARDEYLFYQSLAGAWPAGERVDVEPLHNRLQEYMRKALREAKRFTSWLSPDSRYEEATEQFVSAVLLGEGAGAFLSSFRPFAQRLARYGAFNSLAQLVLKMGMPGVPDLYQGCETWDLSLVDPDNRRPVDYDSLAGAVQEEPAWRDLWRHWPDGRIKQAMTRSLLHLRRRRPALFQKGQYVPLAVSGPLQDHVLAFARVLGGEAALFVASFGWGRLETRRQRPGAEAWAATELICPSEWSASSWRHVFSDQVIRVGLDARLPVNVVFSDFPAAILTAEL